MTPIRWLPAVALSGALACSPGSVPAPEGRMLEEQDFLADPSLRATPQDLVLVQLHRSDAPPGAENGPVVIPFTIGAGTVLTDFCWEDADGVPHAATLREERSNEAVASSVPGQACATLRPPAGDFLLVLDRGNESRVDPADEVVFVQLGATGGAAFLANACPPFIYKWKSTGRSFENVTCSHTYFCEATVTNSRFRGVDLSDSGYPPGFPTLCEGRSRWTGTSFQNTSLAGFRSFQDEWVDDTFDGVDLSRARFWYTKVIRATFQDATLTGIGIRTLDKVPSTEFVDTTFLRGTFSGNVDDDGGDPVRFRATRPDRTTLFKLTRVGPLELGRTEFDHLTWNNVTLTGLVRGGRYLGNVFHGLWLEAATLDGMVFDGCTFEGLASVASPLSTYARLGFRNMNLVEQVTQHVDPDFFRGGIDYTGSTLSYGLAPPAASWRGVDFTRSVVSAVPRDVLRGMDLRGWRAGGASFGFVGGAPDLTGTNLAGADISAWQLQGARLAGADLTGAVTNGARFDNADFSNAKVPGISLLDHDLSSATLIGADFTGATFSGASAAWSDFTNATLAGIVADSSTRVTNFEGAIFDRKTGTSGIDISNANLSHADLSKAYLSGAILRGSRLVGTDLSGADLVAADLSGSTTVALGAILRSANLSGANLAGARLGCDGRSCTKLNDAWMCGANLEGADLRGATLTGAYASPTAIGDPADPSYCAAVAGTPLTDGTTICPNGKPPARASGCSAEEWNPASRPPVTCCVSRKLPDGTWSKCPPRVKKGQPCASDCDCQSKLCPAGTHVCE